MSWNRVYRPRTVADLHLTSVRQLLTALMKSGSFPQVFLFTGPKGTGKTSTARIIGAMLNDEKNEGAVTSIFFKKEKSKKPLVEPDLKNKELDSIYQGQSFLVQEMDAASNRGIDDVRNLKERIQLPPTGGKMAVYILDEVHMLTTEAFNALLKLLEEPPAHVVFILATTELQKVPETVVSRCHVLNFSKATIAELETVVQQIAKKEKLSVPEEVVKYIATQANGSFRDAVKLFEQATQSDALTLEAIQTSLGRNYQLEITKIVSAIIQKDMQQVTQLFEKLRSTQVNESAFHKDVLEYLHQQLLAGLSVVAEESKVPVEAARFLLSEFSAAELSAASPIPLLRLELKALEIIQRAQRKSPASPTRSSTPSTSKKKANIAEVAVQTVTVATAEAQKTVSQVEEQTEIEEIVITQQEELDTEEFSGNGALLLQEWADFVAKVSQENFSLATLLKSARPIAGNTGELTLSVYYKFHKEQLAQPKFQEMLNSSITNSYGPIKINCVLADHPPDAELAEPALDNQLQKLAVDALM